MSLNCEEIEKVVEEIKINGIVKNILQPSKNSIIITIFDGNNNHNILIDVTDKFNRICLIPQNEKIKEEKLRFSQFLNSQLSGARLKNIYQFDMSRIVIIEFSSNNTVKKVIARLWGNAGNILFLENNNNIIDCMKRFSKKTNGRKKISFFRRNKKNRKKNMKFDRNL